MNMDPYEQLWEMYEKAFAQQSKTDWQARVARGANLAELATRLREPNLDREFHRLWLKELEGVKAQFGL